MCRLCFAVHQTVYPALVSDDDNGLTDEEGSDEEGSDADNQHGPAESKDAIGVN